MLHGFKQRVFANTLRATEHERVVDLFLRTLHPVREPFHNMVGVAANHLVHMIEPRISFGGITRFDRRRPIEVEAGHAVLLDPSAL